MLNNSLISLFSEEQKKVYNFIIKWIKIEKIYSIQDYFIQIKINNYFEIEFNFNRKDEKSLEGKIWVYIREHNEERYMIDGKYCYKYENFLKIFFDYFIEEVKRSEK